MVFAMIGGSKGLKTSHLLIICVSSIMETMEETYVALKVVSVSCVVSSILGLVSQNIDLDAERNVIN